MDLDSQPLWERPNSPSFTEFTEHFSNTSLPGSGEISVYHKWDLWLLDVLMIWLIGSLVITPISFLAYDYQLGALGVKLGGLWLPKGINVVHRIHSSI